MSNCHRENCPSEGTATVYEPIFPIGGGMTGRKLYFKIGTGVGNSSGTILNLIRVERIIIKPRLLIRFAGYGANYNRKESKRRMPLP